MEKGSILPTNPQNGDRRKRRKLRRRTLYKHFRKASIRTVDADGQHDFLKRESSELASSGRAAQEVDGASTDELADGEHPGKRILISENLVPQSDRPDNLIEVTGEPLKTDFDILSSHEPSVSSSRKSSETKKDPEVLLFEEAVRQYKSINPEVLIRIAEDARGRGRCSVLPTFTRFGASNFIIFLAFDDEEATRWVARFPILGPGGISPDPSSLRTVIESMVVTMNFVSTNTSIPVPQVHRWDGGTDNELRRPFVIMDAAKGNHLYELEEAGFDMDATVDKLSSFVEQWARYTSELAKLQFDCIGNLNQDSEGNIQVGQLLTHSNLLFSPFLDDDTVRGPFTSVADYLWTESYLAREGIRSPKNHRFELTYNEFLQSKLIESLMPFYIDTALLNGPFVLSHVDFDLQNILVDETDNFKIVSIVDWDLAAVLPLQSHIRIPDMLMCDKWTKSRQQAKNVSPWQLKMAEMYRDHFKSCLINHLRERHLEYPADPLIDTGYLFSRFERAMSETPNDEGFDQLWSHVYGTEQSWKNLLKDIRKADWGTVTAEKLALTIPAETDAEMEKQAEDAGAASPSRPETTDTFWNHFKQATWRARIANKMRWGWWHIERCILCQMGSNRISFLNRRGFSELSAKHGAGRSFEGGEKVASGETGKGNGIGVEELKN